MPTNLYFQKVYNMATKHLKCKETKILGKSV